MSDYPDAVIDLHTHVFNARYLPIKGIMLEAMSPPSCLKRKLARLLDRILAGVAGSSYADRDVTIARVHGDSEDLYADAIWATVEREMEIRAEGYAWSSQRARPRDPLAYLEDRLAEDPLFDALFETHVLFAASGEDAESPSDEDELSGARFAVLDRDTEKARLISEILASQAVLGAEEAERTSVRGLFGLFRKPVRWLLKKIARLARKVELWWDEIGGYLQFFFTLLKAERSVFEALRSSYQQEQNLRLFVHFMMDMEHAYDPPDPPYYRFRQDQLPRMRKLAQESGGLLLGFAAFDPRRDDWAEGFEAALRQGFCGFKFYPPLGYRPAENESQEIQDRVDAFFERCVAEDIPVFTHCTPKGFQAGPGLGRNAHPKYWVEALNKHDGLRLCFGHAGGGTATNGDLHSAGWYAGSQAAWMHKDNFARLVVELCRRHPNVFCEIAHLEELLSDPGKREAFEDNFTREWTSNQGEYLFSEKCMYGSDSHMPGMIHRTTRFLWYFRDLFGRNLDGAFGDFCFANTLRYLDLRGYLRRLRSSDPAGLGTQYQERLEELLS